MDIDGFTGIPASHSLTFFSAFAWSLGESTLMEILRFSFSCSVLASSSTTRPSGRLMITLPTEATFLAGPEINVIDSVRHAQGTWLLFHSLRSMGQTMFPSPSVVYTRQV